MTNCVPSGFGVGPFGTTPYGAGEDYEIGGPLPVTADFDVFCVGPCGPIENVLSYLDVILLGNVANAYQTSQLVLESGYDNSDGVAVGFTVTVPSSCTFEWTCTFDFLPDNFSAPSTVHTLAGISSPSSFTTGLFFSLAGIGFCGAWHYDGFENLVIDAPIQTLPDSAQYIQEGVSITFRLVVNYDENTQYLFITPTSELISTGHQLAFILPIYQSADAPVTPSNQVTFSARGLVSVDSSRTSFDSICLSSSVYLQAVPPIANAGNDQAVQTCHIVQLDGSQSFDPRGLPITYHWRLINAPDGSEFMTKAADGNTIPFVVHPPPAQFTNKFYSDELGEMHNTLPVVAGDVLVVNQQAYDVVTSGTDGNGFYIVIDGYELPDNISNAPCLYIRQNSISGRNEEKATFYPDIPGIFWFDLIVNNGSLSSTRSSVITNVLVSPVPRNVIPDVNFIWNFISDFWRIEENKEWVETFWSGIAQILAAELLNLWQIEYSKSLRDIQRHLQRKWVNYQLRLPELVPEATTSVVILSGLDSGVLDPVTSYNVASKRLVISSDFLEEDVVIKFTGTQTPAQIVDTINDVLATIPQFYCRYIPGNTYASIRLEAGFPFEISSRTTLQNTFFNVGDKNSWLSGSGVIIDTNTVQVDRSLVELDLPTNAMLLVDGVGYRIARVIDNATDEWRYQRIVLVDPLPAGNTISWSIPGFTVSVRTDFYSAMVMPGDIATYEVINQNTEEETLVACKVLGASATSPNFILVDFSPLYLVALNLRDYRVFLRYVTRRTRIPSSPLIVDIPYLQEKIVIEDDTQTLRRNIDFFLEEYRGFHCIRFVTGTSPDPDVWEYQEPPELLWAEYTYLDNSQTIENNFGLAVDFSLDKHSQISHVDYLSAVRGLWYSYFNGATLRNMRVGLQILLGLPFAEEAGTIIEIKTYYSNSQGRILVRDLTAQQIVRSYTYNNHLEMEVNPDTGLPYAVGDVVAQFAPMVKGADVIDYVKQPDWWKGYQSQGLMNEVSKFHRFLVRVDALAFNLPSLLFCREFILRMKPKYTYPYFLVVLDQAQEEISLDDSRTATATLTPYDGAVTVNSYGQATMFDQPRPGVALDAPAAVNKSVDAETSIYNIPEEGLRIGDPYNVQHAGTFNNISLDIAGGPGFSDPDYILEFRVNGDPVDNVSLTLVDPTTNASLTGPYDVVAGDVVEFWLRPTPATYRTPALTNPNAAQLTSEYIYVPDSASYGAWGTVLNTRGPYGDVGPDGAPPVYPDWQFTLFGLDRNEMEARHNIVGTASYVVGGVTLPDPWTPDMDSLLLLGDIQVITTLAHFHESWVIECPEKGHYIHSGATTVVADEKFTVGGGGGDASFIVLEYYGSVLDGYLDYALSIYINDVLLETFPFTMLSTNAHYQKLTFEPAVVPTLVNGDIIQAVLEPYVNLLNRKPIIHRILVQLIKGSNWVLDGITPLTAGTYSVKKSM